MKKILDFLNKYGTLIILALLLVFGMRNCSINSNIKKMDKANTARFEMLSAKIDSLADNTVTKTDLKIEGLKSENRMIQSCDRKMLDIQRQNEIEKEIKSLENR